MLVRVTGGTVASRARVGAAGGEGFLDSAVLAGGSVWSSSDAGATVTRLLPPATIAVAERPGGLTAGGGAIWAFHFLRGTVTRIDLASAAATRIEVTDAADRAVIRLDAATSAALGASTLPVADRSGFVSIAYGDGAAWLTNYDRGTVVRVTAASARRR